MRCFDCIKYQNFNCPKALPINCTAATSATYQTTYFHSDEVERICSYFRPYVVNGMTDSHSDKVDNPSENMPTDSHLHDSGNRKEFSTGAKRDIQEGKGRCDLLPLDVVSDYFFYRSAGDDANHEIGCILTSIHKFIKNHDSNYLLQAIEAFINYQFSDIETAFLELAKHYEDGAKKYGEHNWEKGIPVHSYIDSGIRHLIKFYRGDEDERHDRAFLWNMVGAIWTCKNKPDLIDL